MMFIIYAERPLQYRSSPYSCDLFNLYPRSIDPDKSLESDSFSPWRAYTNIHLSLKKNKTHTYIPSHTQKLKMQFAILKSNRVQSCKISVRMNFKKRERITHCHVQSLKKLSTETAAVTLRK